jgi:hypothetical protein
MLSSLKRKATLAVGENALSRRRIGWDQVQLTGTFRSSAASASWKFQPPMSPTVPFLYGEASSDSWVKLPLASGYQFNRAMRLARHDGSLGLPLSSSV